MQLGLNVMVQSKKKKKKKYTSEEKKLLTSNPGSRYCPHLSYTKVWMNNYRLPFYHHCLQIPGEADWEYDPMIIDQGMPCSPPVVIHDHHQGSQIRQGFWWSVGENFSITIKLPVFLYGENSQGSFTHSASPIITSCWLTNWRWNSNFFMLTALSQRSSGNENWLSGKILCNSSGDLGNPEGMGDLPPWPQG